MSEERIRLNRLLARYGVCSRRAAEDLITSGRVEVDGQVVRDLGTTVPASSILAVDGQVLSGAPTLKYIALNKPDGYVTTRSDERGRPTVMDLLPERLRHLHPVGRLDLDTRGLLLLTNDGDLTQRLTHPSHGVRKVYHARVLGCPPEGALGLLREGVYLAAGPTAPAEVRLLDADTDESVVELVLHEGKKRQVRRMLKAVGHPVIELVRVRVGPMELGDLPEGGYRQLTPAEVAALRESISGEASAPQPARTPAPPVSRPPDRPRRR